MRGYTWSHLFRNSIVVDVDGMNLKYSQEELMNRQQK
jgi:hypothetical protein